MFEFNDIKLNLQMFAGEGGGAAAGGSAGGEGAASAGVAAESGGNVLDAGEQRLRELGVPEERLRKRANRRSAKASTKEVATQSAATAQVQSQQVAAAEQKPESEAMRGTEGVKRTFSEQMESDPEFKAAADQYAQQIVRARLKAEKTSKDTMEKLMPALQVLADRYGQDMNNPDFDALAKAITEDESFYSEEALRKGNSTEEVKKQAQERHSAQRETIAAQQAAKVQQETMREMFERQHFENIARQGEAMKEKYPGFDLVAERQKNATFRRMTDPGSILTVEQAYNAVYFKEIQEAQKQQTAQEAKKQMANSVQSGRHRPVENGISAAAPSVTAFDIKHASKAERDAFRKEVEQARARGQRIFPGTYRS